VYDLQDPDHPEISNWLSANPNRINLGRMSLKYKNKTLSAIDDPYQHLDLWNGVITSRFSIDGQGVNVTTQGDFDSDSVVLKIESNLLSTGELQVEFDFPYPPIHKVTGTFDHEVFMGSYEFPQNHTTSLINCRSEKDSAHIWHQLDETSYFLNLRWPAEVPLFLARNEPKGSDKVSAHRFTLSPSAGDSKVMSFTAQYSPKINTPAQPKDIRLRNSQGWQQYWQEGGFVDLTQSSNPNATELQRRIILSQYAMRVNSAATGQPPQESGLVFNGWWGKFHLEMVVWHCAHWVTWGRQKYFDKIFPAVYESLLPSSKDRAKRMGWAGAR
jgi:hypothetical protein